jgi:asparagine synthase (glutamine-hydrolysing)
MPNIVGIWRPESTRDEIDESLRHQLSTVKARVTSYAEHTHVSAGFGMANQTHEIFENGPQPAYNATRSLALIVDGELANEEELKKRYGRTLPAEAAGTAGLCLALIEEFGTAIVAEFHGSFVIALYDSGTRTLTLISDRLGFRPLFFVDRGDEFLFATELKGIVTADSAGPKIDELGLLELFSYKTNVLGRTWIAGYRRVAPATIMTISPDGRSAEQYWTYRYAESAPTLDQATYFTVFAKLLDRSVERAMRGNRRIGIFLSGGYDSRCIAGAIRPHHAPIPAFTFGDADSRDVIYAAMIADRLGFEHTAISTDGAYLFPNAAAIAWRTEGMVPFANTTSIQYHAALKERLDIILAGFLGEFSGSHIWPQLLRSRTRAAAIDAIYARLVAARSNTVRRVFQSSFFDRNMQALTAEFRASFDSIDNDHPHNVSDVWNFRYLHPQETYHAPAIDRHLFEVRTPLTDADLVDFLLTIPPSARLEQRVFKKMIAYSYPRLRDVPCTNSGQPIDPNFAREYAKMALDWSRRKTAGRLGLRSAASQREFRNLADDFRAEPKLVTDLLQPMMRDGIFSAEIFDVEGIASIVDEHFNHQARHETLLSNLIGWGLAARQLIDGNRDGVPPELTGDD